MLEVRLQQSNKRKDLTAYRQQIFATVGTDSVIFRRRMWSVVVRCRHTVQWDRYRRIRAEAIIKRERGKPGDNRTFCVPLAESLKTPTDGLVGAAYYPDQDQREAGRDPDNQDDATRCG